MYKSKQKELEYLRQYYQKNKEQIKKRTHRNYLKNRANILRRNKLWRKSLHGKIMILKKQYKISYEEARFWLKIKNCQICGDNLAVATDHNHKTGKIRGRLCFRCNRAIGAFKDSPKILLKAVAYLKGK